MTDGETGNTGAVFKARRKRKRGDAAGKPTVSSSSVSGVPVMAMAGMGDDDEDDDLGNVTGVVSSASFSRASSKPKKGFKIKADTTASLPKDLDLGGAAAPTSGQYTADALAELRSEQNWQQEAQRKEREESERNNKTPLQPEHVGGVVGKTPAEPSATTGPIDADTLDDYLDDALDEAMGEPSRVSGSASAPMEIVSGVFPDDDDGSGDGVDDGFGGNNGNASVGGSTAAAVARARRARAAARRHGTGAADYLPLDPRQAVVVGDLSPHGNDDDDEEGASAEFMHHAAAGAEFAAGLGVLRAAEPDDGDIDGVSSAAVRARRRRMREQRGGPGAVSIGDPTSVHTSSIVTASSAAATARRLAGERTRSAGAHSASLSDLTNRSASLAKSIDEQRSLLETETARAVANAEFAGWVGRWAAACASRRADVQAARDAARLASSSNPSSAASTAASSSSSAYHPSMQTVSSGLSPEAHGLLCQAEAEIWMGAPVSQALEAKGVFEEWAGKFGRQQGKQAQAMRQAFERCLDVMPGGGGGERQQAR